MQGEQQKSSQDAHVASAASQEPAAPMEEVPTNTSGDDLKTLSVRAYLDRTVVPVLLLGLAETAKERPSNPVEFLANFLLKNNPQVKQE